MSAPPSLRWTLERARGRTIVELAGHLDERADLAPLGAELSGVVELRLGGVVRVNSTGVRTWVDFVHDLPSVTELIFSQCSPAVVTQLNTIYNFRGPARVSSILLPYACEACGTGEFKLVDVSGYRPSAPPRLPEFACERCGGPLEFDELPERYLSFLDG